MPRTKARKNPKGGAPTSYRPCYVEEAYYLCSKFGATKDMLADHFEVADSSAIYTWMTKHPKFDTAIKKGTWEFDSGRVAKSLLKRALGCEYDEISEESICIRGTHFVETTEPNQVGENKKGDPVFRNCKVLTKGRKIKIVHKQILPDVGAIVFWLCNRQPELWAHVQKQLIEHTGKIEHELTDDTDLSKLNKSDLESVRDVIEKAQGSKDPDTEPSQSSLN